MCGTGIEPVRLDPGAGVGDDELHAIDLGADGDLERAAVGHRVARVHGEVREHLLELPAVAADEAAGVGPRHERHLLAEQAREQASQPEDDLAEVEHLRLGHLASAEGEQLCRQGGGAVGGADDLERVRPARVVVVEARREEFAVAADRREQVVEVVRDPAREPAHRLELLRVEELLAQRPLVGDVTVVDDDDRLAVVAPQPADGLDGAPRAVAVAQADLDRLRLLAREDRGEDVRDPGLVAAADERERGHADQLGGLPADDALDGRALVQRRPVRGDQRDRVRRVLDQRPEELLTAAQHLLRLALRGHVRPERDDALRLALVVADDQAAPRERPPAAVAREDLSLVVRRQVAVVDGAAHALAELVGVGDEAGEPVLAQHLLPRPAGQAEQVVVREGEPAVEVERERGHGDVLERLPEAALEERRLVRGRSGHDRWNTPLRPDSSARRRCRSPARERPDPVRDPVGAAARGARRARRGRAGARRALRARGGADARDGRAGAAAADRAARRPRLAGALAHGALLAPVGRLSIVRA
jgi:hypothetical protein